MSCKYKYNNIEFESKQSLEAYLAENPPASISEANTSIIELNTTFEDPVIIEGEIAKEVENMAGSLENLSFFGSGSKSYASINQRLFDEETGTVKILKDYEGNEIEVDIAVEFEKLKNDQPLRDDVNYMELYDAIENHMADLAYSDTISNMVGGATPRESSLINKLVEFASSLGISIETMDNYMAQYEQRNGTPASVNALADMLNQIVAITNTGTVADFTEEIAHFAIEYYNGQEEIEDMMRNVDQTVAYSTYAEQYRQLYSAQGLTGQELENKIRKEVLGKILAQKIADNFAQNQTNLSETGIFSTLQRLLGEFLDLFTITDSNAQFFKEFGKTLDFIAESTTTNTMFSNFTARDSKEVYYSATKQDRTIENVLKRTQQELEQKYKQIVKGGEATLKGTRLNDLERVANKIAENDYMGALKGYIDFLYLEIEKNDNQIEKAVADAESVLRGKRIGQNLDPDGFTQEELYKEVSRQLEVDTANLIIFNSDIEDIIEHLSNQIDLIRNRSNVPANYIRTMNKKIDIIRNRARNTKNHTTPLARNVTKSEVRYTLDNLGVPEKDIQRVIDRINENNERDRNWFTSFVFSLSSHSNPIVGTMVLLLKKAYNQAQAKARDFGFKMARLAEELNIDNGLAKKLINKAHMIAPWDVTKFEDDYYKALNDAIAPIAEQLNSLDKSDLQYLEKRTDLENQIEIAKEGIRQEWLESQFSNYNTSRVRERGSVNPITNQKTRTANSQKLIRELARNRIEITSKYSKGELMSRRDQRALQAIINKRKQYMSFYNPDGSIKDKEELAIAYDLMDYYNFDGTSEGVSDQARFEFENERQRVANTYGEDSVEYDRWLSQYAYYKYPDSFYNNSDFNVVIDEEETRANLKKLGYSIDDIRALVVGGKSMNLQELYQALLDKRTQLVAPYRVRNKSGEIDGQSIERDMLLVSTISEVEQYLSNFKKEDSEFDFTAEPNESFVSKYYELLKQGDQVALNQWLIQNGANKRKLVNKVPLPTTYFYRKYTSNTVPRVHEPTLQWQMEYEDSLELNANYNKDLKGKALQPSAAKMKEYSNKNYFDLFGINPNNPFSDKATKNKNLWEFRKFLLTEKYFMDRKVGQKYAYFQLPQVRAHKSERVLDLNRGLGSRIRTFLDDAFVIDNMEDEFSVELNREGGVFKKGQTGLKVIPKFYTRLMPENKRGDLSQDISYMFGKYAAMSYNYDEKSKIFPKVHAMRETILNITNENSSVGEDRKLSRTIKQVDEYLDSHMYGNLYKDIGGIMGKNGSYISATKALNSLNKAIRWKNLGLNSLVALTSPIVATLERRAMASENKHLSQVSIAFANRKLNYGADLIQMVGETATLRPDSLSRQVLEQSGVAYDLNDVTVGGLQDRVGRTISQFNPAYDLVGYKVLGRSIAAITVLSVYDNYRLVDGSFISYKQFIENNSGKSKKEIKEAWDRVKDKSYFNFLKENDNRLSLDVDKLNKEGYKKDLNFLEDRMRIAAQEANDYVEGQVNTMDKNLVSKNPFLSILLMIHRNYFQRFLENRFKSEGVNMTTGTVEEGHYRTVGRLMMQNMTNEDGKLYTDPRALATGIAKNLLYLGTRGTIDWALNNGNLTETEKSNLKRIQSDFIYVYTASFALFVLMNLIADGGDDDDRLKQYMALVASRVFLESTSTRYNAIGGLQSTIDMFESPSAGYSTLGDLLTYSDLVFFGGEELQSGHYKGYTKRMKALIKSTPLKNVYEPLYGDPRSSNMFYRSRLLPAVSINAYETIEETVN